MTPASSVPETEAERGAAPAAIAAARRPAPAPHAPPRTHALPERPRVRWAGPRVPSFLGPAHSGRTGGGAFPRVPGAHS